MRSPPAGDYAIAQIDKVFKGLEVALLTEKSIVWEIEPLPENYDQQILRF
ncbi:hypothetical protein ANSO36C_06810 [Nostoc cf. commune SO-36]|uniref:Uncharacterized protein n=1 Tax=Nostoc cf. commune SO-36 TaxID=449208 RepID=A0ABM7YW65_NOSCO|nr:hypothetical protein [Nostoc commune]BDI14879.1 hypothetical protein ANSO36C_06810 [Nostoc cf. commune SO-36]